MKRSSQSTDMSEAEYQINKNLFGWWAKINYG
jgi:hypothetical protein